MTTTMPSLAEHALRYAAAGWAIVPARGTVPLVPRATTNAATIRRWWRQWPSANIAAVLPVGVVVLEIDRPSGAATIGGLEAEHGLLPATLEAVTDTRDRHLYYLGDLPQGADLGPGVAVLQGGSAVVLLPPSTTADGLGHRRYRWADPATPMAALPEWIAERLRPREVEHA